jgi:hypothetical protein
MLYTKTTATRTKKCQLLSPSSVPLCILFLPLMIPSLLLRESVKGFDSSLRRWWCVPFSNQLGNHQQYSLLSSQPHALQFTIKWWPKISFVLRELKGKGRGETQDQCKVRCYVIALAHQQQPQSIVTWTLSSASLSILASPSLPRMPSSLPSGAMRISCNISFREVPPSPLWTLPLRGIYRMTTCRVMCTCSMRNQTRGARLSNRCPRGNAMRRPCGGASR